MIIQPPPEIDYYTVVHQGISTGVAVATACGSFILGATTAPLVRRLRQRRDANVDAWAPLPTLQSEVDQAIDEEASRWAESTGRPWDGPIAANYARTAARLRVDAASRRVQKRP